MYSRRDKNEVRLIRHARVRKNLSGTSELPRLCVYRSLNHIYAQVIDDSKAPSGVTLVSASSLEQEIKDQIAGLNKKDVAKVVGKAVAERALKAGVEKVVFDRGGYLYTGRVQSLAEGAREAGLKF
ncbi:MAG: 50S ribosomal protein L18 [Eubacteriales bacterium]|nr:50S ribosomal protein L18 [Eubacteriales bacterium]